MSAAPDVRPPAADLSPGEPRQATAPAPEGRFHFLELGVLLAILWWLTESMLHAWVFDGLPLASTLLCEHDPNELWMRSAGGLLLIGLGRIADRALAAERRDRLRTENILGLASTVYQVSASPRRAESLRCDGGPRPTNGQAWEATATDAPLRHLSNAVLNLCQSVARRQWELEGLLNVSREIGHGQVVEDVLDRTYDAFRSLIPYDRIGVALVDTDGKIVRAFWARSDEAAAVPEGIGVGYAAPLAGSSLERILETGEPRIIADLDAYLREHPTSKSTRRILAEGMRSSLTCPLINEGRPVGFLFFSSRQPHAYRADHAGLFRVVAGHVADAIGRARLLDQLEEQRRRATDLLLNVMPERMAKRLQDGIPPVAEGHDEAAVLFVDLVGFTPMAAEMSPADLARFLHGLFSEFDSICERNRVEKIKTIGDAYMAIAGVEGQGGLASLAKTALDMLEEGARWRRPDGTGMELRAGLHIGPLIAGVIGRSRFSFDVWGDTVNVASRLQVVAEPGTVLTSGIVRERLGREFAFSPRGPVHLAGWGEMDGWLLGPPLAADPTMDDEHANGGGLDGVG